MLFEKRFEKKIRKLHSECDVFIMIEDHAGYDRHGPKATYHYIFVTSYDDGRNITTCNVYTAYQNYTSYDNPKEYDHERYEFEGKVSPISSLNGLKKFTKIL